MMSFTLMGCLIFSASDAMAQGRSRSQGGSSSSRSQSAAVSRSNSSAAPQVSRSSSSSSSRSQATPQVNRSNPTTSRSQTSPQVNRSNPTTGAPTSVERRSDTRPSTVTTPSSGTPNRSNSSSHSSGSRNQGHGNGNGTIDRGGNSSGQSGSGHVAPLDNKTKHTTSRTGMTDDRTKASSPNSTTGTRVGKPGGDKPGGNGGGKPNGGNGGGKPNGGVSGGNHGDKPGGGHGNEGHGKRPNDKGNGHKGNGHKGNDRHGFDSRNHYDYTGHHYRNDFHRNYTHHNWSRPLPPPARPYRPAPIVWYRPVIPAGWTPYYGAPVIDRILGITFGTLFDVSLDYLYYNGYYIDGYADNIIYLREVPLLNLIWDDVMLCYDSSSRLVNAQFIIQSASYNTYRYDRVYRNLCRVYGNPVARTSEGISWYGGNSTGWVTLSMHNNLGHYYTTLSIGY